MKPKNYFIDGDAEKLARLKAELDFIGRECEIRDGRLVVFALPQKKAKPKGGARGARRGR
jgi:hypothetical protein